MNYIYKFKKHIIISLLLFVLFSLLCIKYYFSIKIYQPINIYVSGLNNTELNSTNFNAITPFNRSFKIKVINDNSEISINKTIAFYKNIELIGIDSILLKIKQIRIKIGATSYLFENEKIKKEWRVKNREKDVITYQCPNYIKDKISPIIIIKSLLEFKDLLIVVTLLILISVIFIFYKSISQKILKFLITVTKLIKTLINTLRGKKVKINLIFIQSKTTQVLTIIILILTYFIVFITHFDFSNDVGFGGDQLYYQSMAVNFVKGHGYPKVGGLEEFEEYKFSLNNVNKPAPSIMLFEKSAGPYSFSKHPIYPLFIGIIYKIFGINPVLIKYLQLMMMIIVSSFLPWLGYKFWNNRGYISGLIASPLFLIYNCNFVMYIFTEPLIVFTIFLIVFAYIYYTKKNTLISVSVLGIILGFSLLLKGSLILIPVLIIIYLFKKYKRLNEKKILTHVLLIGFFIVITVLPWAVYANIKNRKNVKLAKKSLEILSNKKLSKEYKSAFIDSSSLIYTNINPYPLFLANIKNVKDVLSLNGVPLEDRYLYYDSSTIYNKIVLQKFYLQSNRFIIFSSQSPQILLDGNCEIPVRKEQMKGADGATNWWIRDLNCFYYHDKMEDSPAILRVINFYLHFPRLFFEIIGRKLVLGFFRLKFLWVIIYLFILESIRGLINKFNNNRIFYKFYNILTMIAITFVVYIIGYFNPPVPSIDSLAFYLIVLAIIIFSFIVNIKNKFKDLTFTAPDIFHIIFINFFIITLIVMGFERQNGVINFILTLTAINYLISTVEKIIKDFKLHYKNQNKIKFITDI